MNQNKRVQTMNELFLLRVNIMLFSICLVFDLRLFIGQEVKTESAASRKKHCFINKCTL